jgi:hypothetical protein
MTDEQIDVAIAKHMGWKDLHEIQQIASMHHGWCGVNPESGYDEFIPEYCYDLNAMHEAEKTLNTGKINTYIGHLYESNQAGILSPNLWERIAVRRSTHASARKRAEAFLRTIGKWEEA